MGAAADAKAKAATDAKAKAKAAADAKAKAAADAKAKAEKPAPKEAPAKPAPKEAPAKSTKSISSSGLGVVKGDVPGGKKFDKETLDPAVLDYLKNYNK